MASFRESIDALKEAGLADLEILEIMFNSVDRQINITASSNTNKSGRELPENDSNINAETPSVRKKEGWYLQRRKTPQID